MIRIFIGYTQGAPALFNVLQHSIHQRSSRPVSVTPLMLSQLASIHGRVRDPLQSTDFSFTRFLVPFLCGYSGWAIYMDNDMLVRDDVAKLWSLRDERFAVMCVKHDHVPRERTKFLGAPQTRYEKKNWSSLMLFNCERCRMLDPQCVEVSGGLDLHQFRWLGNEALIGELPSTWNHLVGVQPPNPEAKNVHFTLGGPYFEDCRDVEFANEWLQEREQLLTVHGSER